MITFKKSDPTTWDVYANGKWMDTFWLADDDSCYLAGDGDISRTYLADMKALMVDIHSWDNKPLPSRHQRGLVLSAWYEETEKKWNLEVGRLGYSASLMCADHEGELHDGDGNFMELSDKDMLVIDKWVRHEDDYITLFEHETGLIEVRD